MYTGRYENIQGSTDKPRPKAYLKVVNPSSSSRYGEVEAIEAIVDSGATMTCIPESIIARVGYLEYSHQRVRDANNNVVLRKSYILNITIGNYTFNDLEVIGFSKSYALLGCDILNQSKIMLDAPNNRWIYNCPGKCLESDGTTVDATP
ncbi:MAG: retropepsin-like aspartic protease [Microcystis panniformis]